jgi:hypothetical protein
VKFEPFGQEPTATLPLSEPAGQNSGWSNLAETRTNNNWSNCQIMKFSLIRNTTTSLNLDLTNEDHFDVYVYNNPEQFNQSIYNFTAVYATHNSLTVDVTSFFQVQGSPSPFAIFELPIGAKGFRPKKRADQQRKVDFMTDYAWYEKWTVIANIAAPTILQTTADRARTDCYSEYTEEALSLEQALQLMARKNEIAQQSREQVKLTLNNTLWDMQAVAIGKPYELIFPFTAEKKKYILKTIKATNSITSDTTVDLQLEFVTENELNSQMSELRPHLNWDWNSDIEVMDIGLIDDRLGLQDEFRFRKPFMIYTGSDGAVPLFYQYTEGYCG